MTEIEEAEVVEDNTLQSTAMEVAQSRQSLAQADELTIDQLVAQVQKVQQAMHRVMTNGEHYGTIPGTNKPTLLKPGAEKLLLLFRLGPSYDISETWHDDGHYTVRSVCRLTHIASQNFVAAGEGLCSTKESKYAYRKGERTCPNCQSTAIIKGKKEYGGGWLCWKNKGGCGSKWDDGDQAIEGQSVDRVPNPDLADSYNTVLKMACKRALIAAVLNGTAASDIFTQDLDDQVSGEARPPQPSPETSGEVSPEPSKAQSSKEEPKAKASTPRPSGEVEAQSVVSRGGEVHEGSDKAEASSEDIFGLIANAMTDDKLAAKLEGFANVAAIREKCLPSGGVNRQNILDLPETVLEAVATKAKLRLKETA